MDFRAIEDLLAHVNIVDIIGSYIPLKKAGNSYKALCPFHEEKTPSFNVSPQKQIFKCFGCGEGGSAIKFVQKYEKISFWEAVRKVASMSGYNLPDSLKPHQKKNTKYDLVYQVYELAKTFFSKNLWEHGTAALAYIKDRGFSQETARKFEFGYALDSYNALSNFLQKNQIDPRIFPETGLFGSNDRGSYDLFRDRLIIPIHSSSNRVVAFGGRKLSDEKKGGKYINSPTTMIYTKGKELFGLHLTKYDISKADSVIITEGYLDMLRLYEHGFCNSVASLGTALTDDQITLLSRYTQNFLLLYDGDNAGTKAAIKAAAAATRLGCNCKIISLPHQEDPDSFLIKHGKNEMIKIISQAVNLTQFLKNDQSLQIPQHKKITYLIDIAANIAHDSLRSLFLKNVSEAFGISYPAIISKFKNKIILEDKDISLDYLEEKKFPEEQQLIKLLLENTELLLDINEEIDSDFFLQSDCREIFEVLLEQKDNVKQASAYEMLLSPAAWTKLSEIMLQNTPEIDPSRIIKDIKLRKFRQDLKRIKQNIKNNGVSEALLSQFQEIEKKVRSLAPPAAQKLIY